MLYKVSKRSACTIFEKKDENLDEYIYGIQLFISSFVCTVLLLVLGLSTKTFVESVVFIFSFSALRVYTGGYHSNSFVMCNLFTLLIYVLIVLVYKYMFEHIVKSSVCILVFVITIMLIVFFSPVENENNPLTKKQSVLCKIKAIVVVIVETVICFVSLYILKYENIAIMIPTLFFVVVLIVMGLIKNKGGD